MLKATKNLVLTLQTPKQLQRLIHVSKKVPVVLVSQGAQHPNKTENKHIWQTLAESEKFSKPFVVAFCDPNQSPEIAKLSGLTASSVRFIENQKTQAHRKNIHDFQTATNFLASQFYSDEMGKVLEHIDSLERTHQHQAAASALQQAIENKQTNSPAHLKLRLIENYLRLGETLKAQQLFEDLSLVERNSNYGKYLSALLFFYEQLHHWDQFIESQKTQYKAQQTNQPNSYSKPPATSEQAKFLEFLTKEDMPASLIKRLGAIPESLLKGYIADSMEQLLALHRAVQSMNHARETHQHVQTMLKQATNLIHFHAPSLAKQFQRKINQQMH